MDEVFGIFPTPFMRAPGTLAGYVPSMTSSENVAFSARSKHGGAKVGFPPPLVFLGLLGAGVALERWGVPLALPIPFWPRLIAGVATAFGGLAMVLSARSWFLRTGQDPKPWRPSPELLVRGIYRYTRNPMYLGITLFQLGLGIATGSGWIAALAPLALAIVHFIAVRPEEAYLAEKFGTSYLEYRAAVRRYL
jgi:protein-S-isoprenylcysteine O-methyltransferase Ste14